MSLPARALDLIGKAAMVGRRADRPTAGDLYARAIEGGERTATGRRVDEAGALRTLAVYACVRVIAETVATLPGITYRRTATGKDRAPRHRLYRTLHDRPNPEMTSVEWRETMLGHALLWGNAYNEIEADRRGRPVALWPLRPDMMQLDRDDRDQPIYVYTLPDGKPVGFRRDQIHHVRAFGSGLLGLSPIAVAREAIGLALAVEEYGARFFGNDSRPGGILVHPARLGAEAAKNIKASWEEAFKGLSNRHRVAVLEEGMQWQAVGVPPQDAQFLETRKFQLDEIARLFRVPPHMIGILDRATWGNIEHQAIDFVTHTIRPWLVRLEQAADRDLFARTDPLPVEDGVEVGERAHFVEYLVDGLLRGDATARANALAVQRQNGVITANEWRALENRNPIDGGDALLVNGNMVPVDQAGKAPAPAAGPPSGDETPAGAAARALALTRDLLASGNGRHP